MKKGWEVKKLGEVCSLEYGKPLEKNARTESGLYPAYGANGVFARTNKYYYDKPSIIIGRKGTAGALTLTDDKFYPLDVTYYVVFDERYFDRKFLYYFLNTKNLPSLAKGVKPGINRHDVYALPISYPSLLEQQRIVKILDAAFTKINTVKQNAKCNLNNTKELFKNTLNDLLLEKGQTKKLSEICQFINGKAYKKEELLDEGKYLVLRVGNFFTSNNWFYSDLELSADKYCDNGDLLYAWSASFGPRIWEGQKVIYHYHIWKVIPNKKYVSKMFLFWLLEWDTESIKRAYGTGTTMMHVSKNSIENRTIRVPPLSKQSQIVTKLEALSVKCKELENNYRQTISDCDEMKKSILAKAFNGEL